MLKNGLQIRRCGITRVWLTGGDAAKIWTDLCNNSKTLPIFNRAQEAKRDPDLLRVVPADVRVNDFDELINRRGLPGTTIEVPGNDVAAII